MHQWLHQPRMQPKALMSCHPEAEPTPIPKASSSISWEAAVTLDFQLNQTVCAVLPDQPFLPCCTLRHKDCFLLHGSLFWHFWMVLWLGCCCCCTDLTLFATMPNTANESTTSRNYFISSSRNTGNWYVTKKSR